MSLLFFLVETTATQYKNTYCIFIVRFPGFSLYVPCSPAGCKKDRSAHPRNSNNHNLHNPAQMECRSPTCHPQPGDLTFHLPEFQIWSLSIEDHMTVYALWGEHADVILADFRMWSSDIREKMELWPALSNTGGYGLGISGLWCIQCTFHQIQTVYIIKNMHVIPAYT